MTERIWEDLLTERDKQVITEGGYDEHGAGSWDSRGLGENPMVFVIDMQRFIVGDDVPILESIESFNSSSMGSVAHEGIENIAPFLDHARENDVPITYTRVVPSSYDDPEHEDLAIVDPIAPEDGDLVLDKSYASAFFGTDLTSRLVREKVDTLVVVGNSTSGCVRATAIDGQQLGFNVVVPQECVFDRIEASHKVALLDLWMKYAEVMEQAEVERYLEGVDA
jgi:nicotinamidase-related amidase